MYRRAGWLVDHKSDHNSVSNAKGVWYNQNVLYLVGSFLLGLCTHHNILEAVTMTLLLSSEATIGFQLQLGSMQVLPYHMHYVRTYIRMYIHVHTLALALPL